ncbi:MAG: glycosyltransferase family 2 protein [Myxococcota bacterium]
MNAPFAISMVFVCLDEARTIAACVREAQRVLDPLGRSYEIVVADNGSRDGSQALAQAAGARVAAVQERGYGRAIVGGIEAARGDIVIVADGDGTYDLSCIPQLLAALDGGATLAIGCRLASGGGHIEPGAMPWSHRWGNPALSALGRLLSGAPVRDFHSGIRAFFRAPMRVLGLRSPGMELASEMVARAYQAGFVIAEVPATLRPAAPGRVSHLRTMRDGLRHVVLLLQQRTRR